MDNKNVAYSNVFSVLYFRVIPSIDEKKKKLRLCPGKISGSIKVVFMSQAHYNVEKAVMCKMVVDDTILI